ncbi:MAG: helix-turn-helix transcriptional regulator [Actinomycetota bacterium]|nr:helix-turn-helix transcriptional regulator [Actinomycetota bacterium]
MRTYGQYCPIARTSELFAERWTPILIRNLLAGCRTFGDLLSGAPGISKALLAQRLELLEAHGILIKETNSSGRGYVYSLTEKGRELKAITDAMGSWGARWLELQPHHIDPAYVLWATCKLVDLKRVPSKGLVARIDLTDSRKERFWMLIKPPHAEVCSTYPGGNEDLIVRTDSETLARWHLRHVTYEEAERTGRIRIEGVRSSVKAFLDCIRPSPFANVKRASAKAG